MRWVGGNTALHVYGGGFKKRVSGEYTGLGTNTSQSGSISKSQIYFNFSS